MKKVIPSLLLGIILLPVLACSSLETTNPTSSLPETATVKPIASNQAGMLTSNPSTRPAILNPSELISATNPGQLELKIETDFGQLLSCIPASMLDGELWFTDWSRVKKLNGAEDITNLPEFYNLMEKMIKDHPQTTVDWSVCNEITALHG
jgi:hypothetical protein